MHSHEVGRFQPLRINVDLEAEQIPNEHDSLDDIVDYAVIESKIRNLVRNDHIRMVETLKR